MKTVANMPINISEKIYFPTLTCFFLANHLSKQKNIKWELLLNCPKQKPNPLFYKKLESLKLKPNRLWIDNSIENLNFIKKTIINSINNNKIKISKSKIRKCKCEKLYFLNEKPPKFHKKSQGTVINKRTGGFYCKFCSSKATIKNTKILSTKPKKITPKINIFPERHKKYVLDTIKRFSEREILLTKETNESNLKLTFKKNIFTINNDIIWAFMNLFLREIKNIDIDIYITSTKTIYQFCLLIYISEYFYQQNKEYNLIVHPYFQYEPNPNSNFSKEKLKISNKMLYPEIEKILLGRIDFKKDFIRLNQNIRKGLTDKNFMNFLNAI